MDAKNQAYQCVSKHKKKDSRTLTFLEAEAFGLKCVSGDELELLLKACKKKVPLPDYTLCEMDSVRNKFFCKAQSKEEGEFRDIEACENFVCTDDTDRRRLIERCK